MILFAELRFLKHSYSWPKPKFYFLIFKNLPHGFCKFQDFPPHVSTCFHVSCCFHPSPFEPGVQNSIFLSLSKSHRRRSLVGCSPWGRWGLDMTEQLHFHFSLSCIAEGNETHFNVLAWRIPGTGETGGLPSLGLHRVGHDWSDLAAAVLFFTQNIF